MLVAQVDVHLPITWMTSGSRMLLNAMRWGNSVQSKGRSLPVGHELALLHANTLHHQAP